MTSKQTGPHTLTYAIGAGPIRDYAASRIDKALAPLDALAVAETAYGEHDTTAALAQTLAATSAARCSSPFEPFEAKLVGFGRMVLTCDLRPGHTGLHADLGQDLQSPLYWD